MAKADDMQLEQALVDYADTLGDAGSALIQRMRADSSFYASMGKALSEIAMLIAGSAVIESDDEFGKMHRRVLYEAREDSVEVQALRTYFLTHRNAIDLSQVLTDDEVIARFEARITEWSSDYRLLHAPVAAVVRTTKSRSL